MIESWLRRSLVVLMVPLSVLPARPVVLGAQQRFEIAVGWNAVAPARSSTFDRDRSGPYMRGSIGQDISPRIRVRYDAVASLFRLDEIAGTPCPPEVCPNFFYDTHIRAVAGFITNSLLRMDHKGILHLIVGLGAYETIGHENSAHLGASGGLNVGMPVGASYRLAVEGTWHALIPDGPGPAWVAPIALSFAF